MKIKIKGIEHEFDEERLTNLEAMAIEKVTGATFGEFGEQLTAGSALALTAVVWTLQKRANPNLKFSEVEFAYGDLEVIDDEEDEAPKDEAPSADVEAQS